MSAPAARALPATKGAARAEATKTRRVKWLALARAACGLTGGLAPNGIDPSRLQVKPEGETTKYDSRRTEEGYAQNRRVHFVILP